MPDLVYGVTGSGNSIAGVRLEGAAGAGRAILFGFGFESIDTDSVRKEVL